jgi:hypothetical protein
MEPPGPAVPRANALKFWAANRPAQEHVTPKKSRLLGDTSHPRNRFYPGSARCRTSFLSIRSSIAIYVPKGETVSIDGEDLSVPRAQPPGLSGSERKNHCDGFLELDPPNPKNWIS